MSRFKSCSRLLPVGLAVLMAAPLLVTDAKPANADVRIRIGGKVRVKVRPHHVHVRHYRHRTHLAPYRLRIRGSLVLGGGLYFGRAFAEPPPPPVDPCDCSACECGSSIPAYYTPPAPPAPPAPPPVVVDTRTPDPIGPRLGIGLFAGQMAVEDVQGEDVGLLARYRLTRSLSLEAEVAKTRLEDQDEERRLGGALLWDLSPRSNWSPHLVGGLGAWENERYAEAGAGLTYRLTQRLHLAADVRAGLRGEKRDCDHPLPENGVPICEQAGAEADNDSSIRDDLEGYTRGRLSAILYF